MENEEELKRYHVSFAVNVTAGTEREAAEKTWEMLNNMAGRPTASVMSEDGEQTLVTLEKDSGNGTHPL